MPLFGPRRRNYATAPGTTGTTITTTTTTRRRLGGRTRHHQRRHVSIGDKVSGALMVLNGIVTRRSGKKAAGTRRMRGTDGKGSHHVEVV